MKELIDYLDTTAKGRSLSVNVKLRIADEFKTHPEKVSTGLVADILQLIEIHKPERLQSKGKTKSAEEFLRNKSYPSGVSDTDWEDFKHREKGVLFVPFAIKAMEEYAQSHAKPNHSGKTKEQVWEEVQSYHQIEGMVLKGSRGEAAVYDAMERFTNQDGWVRVDKDNLPGEEVVVLRKSGKKHLGTFKMDKYMNVLCEIGVDIVIDVTHWLPLPEPPQP